MTSREERALIGAVWGGRAMGSGRGRAWLGGPPRARILFFMSLARPHACLSRVLNAI